MYSRVRSAVLEVVIIIVVVIFGLVIYSHPNERNSHVSLLSECVIATVQTGSVSKTHEIYEPDEIAIGVRTVQFFSHLPMILQPSIRLSARIHSFVGPSECNRLAIR